MGASRAFALDTGMEREPMSAEPQRGDTQPISLDTAKVLHVDPLAASRSQLKGALREIGFLTISGCESFDRVPKILGTEIPDLLFVDIDAEPNEAFRMIRAIRNGDIGESPFVVIFALTQNPEREAVQTALQVGADDMIVRPVGTQILRQRVMNQIENRKEFIATEDYVGPDRRADDRELTEDDPPSIKVPNSLRHAATGDESAALTDDRIKETFRNLSVQKLCHLSSRMVQVADRQKDALAGGGDSGDCSVAVGEISDLLGEIETIIDGQDFQGVEQVVASSRKALADIEACGDEMTARQFELLHAYGNSIGIVLKEGDDSAGVLISALEKAVAAVKAKSNGPAADCAPESAGAAEERPAGGAREEGPRNGAEQATPPAPEPTPAEEAAKAPLKVRLQAWWDGVDPQDIDAGATE